MTRLIPQNRYLAIAALAALCVSVILILDKFELPFGSSIVEALTTGSVLSVNFLGYLTTLGYGGLFILMVLESASLPIPSEVVLPITGYLVYLGAMDFGVAVAVSTVAGVVGAFVDYILGLKLGRPFVGRLLKRFGVGEKRLDQAERWVSSKGSWSVLFARFVPGLRSIISIPAGVLRMRVQPFFLMTLVGSFAWSTLLIYLGYSSGPLWETALTSVSIFLVQFVVVALAAVSFLYIVYFLIPPKAVAPPVGSGPGAEPGIFSFAYWQSFIKFNVVGLTGVFMNESVLILLTTWGVFYLYSSAVAIELSILSNFFLNDVWTFRDRRSGHLLVRLSKFNGLMVAGLGTNLAIIYAATTYFGVHYALSNLIGISAAFLLRYALSVRYTWLREERLP